MSNEFYDNDDQASQKKLSESQRKKRLQSAVSAVLSTDDGRLVLAAIMQKCQIESQNVSDGAAAFRIEGARMVGLQIQNMLRSNDYAGFMKLYGELYYVR